MVPEHLPAHVQQLVTKTLVSIDHLTVLMSIRSATPVAVEVDHVTSTTGVLRTVAESVLVDLRDARLITYDGSRYCFSPADELKPAVDSLIEMYNTKPVSLIRAVYDRALDGPIEAQD